MLKYRVIAGCNLRQECAVAGRSVDLEIGACPCGVVARGNTDPGAFVRACDECLFLQTTGENHTVKSPKTGVPIVTPKMRSHLVTSLIPSATRLERPLFRAAFLLEPSRCFWPFHMPRIIIAGNGPGTPRGGMLTCYPRVRLSRWDNDAMDDAGRCALHSARPRVPNLNATGLCHGTSRVRNRDNYLVAT